MTVSSLRETLVATGVEILDADGATELTLREIARRAGVSHGAPRRYFPTHNSLLAAIAHTACAISPTDSIPSSPANNPLVAD